MSGGISDAPFSANVKNQNMQIDILILNVLIVVKLIA